MQVSQKLEQYMGSLEVQSKKKKKFQQSLNADNEKDFRLVKEEVESILEREELKWKERTKMTWL